METKPYRLQRQKVTLAISPQTHILLKLYATGRQLRLEEATEELLKIAFGEVEGFSDEVSIKEKIRD